MLLICRLRSTSCCDRWLEQTLPLFANWDANPYCASSNHEMNHDHRSVPAFSSAFQSFLPLTHFTIWKSDFGWACPLHEMLRCHWSLFRLISTFHYGSHLMHSTPPTTTFFLASLIHEMPFYHQPLSFRIGAINSWCPLPHSCCFLF